MSSKLRLYEKMGYILPIVREAGNVPIYCQLLERPGPIVATSTSVRGADWKTFALFGDIKSKIL